jgi:ABC-type transport system substrate-binding protein
VAFGNLSRRDFIRNVVVGAGAVSTAALLQACGVAPSPSPSAPSTAPTQAAPAAAPKAAATNVQPDAAPAGPLPFRKDTVAGAETPKRGGTMTVAQASDWAAWDPTKAQAIRVSHMFFTHNKLIQGNWTKGPHGDGSTTWEWGYLGDVSLLTGELAERWETPDPTTIIYHLRQGVKFHNKPPVNGRELTADDVVWNINMQLTYRACGRRPSARWTSTRSRSRRRPNRAT